MKVLLVGHCMADRFLLSSALKSALPEAKTEGVNSDKDLDRHLGEATLLLVNRVLDGRFRTDDGIALIVRLREAGAEPALMLISNYDDAQAAAEDAGAAPGFGKSALRSEETVRRLRSAAGV